MHLRRWVLALVITLMLIDSWMRCAEATSIEPNCCMVNTACLALPFHGRPGGSR